VSADRPGAQPARFLEQGAGDEVSPADPVTLAGVASLLLATAALACLIRTAGDESRSHRRA
jgi:hypothetical protein